MDSIFRQNHYRLLVPSRRGVFSDGSYVAVGHFSPVRVSCEATLSRLALLNVKIWLNASKSSSKMTHLHGLVSSRVLDIREPETGVLSVFSTLYPTQ